MKNYVSKLNDRNLQRKRESGLTSYVLFSIIIVACYKISDLYPLIPFRKSLWEILPILASTFNIVLAVMMIIMVYNQTTNHVTDSRIILNSNSSNLLDECLIYSLLIIPFSSTFSTCIWNYNHNLNNVYFIIMSIILFIFLLVIFGVVKFHKIATNNTLELYDGTGNKINDRDYLSITIYIMSLFFITYSFFIILNSSPNISKLNVFLFGVLLYSLPYLLLKIMELREADNFTKSLENLEYEINVRELKDEEIRIRLQQNYYGFLIPDWINYNSQLFEDIKLDFEKKQANLEILEYELSKVDKNENQTEYTEKSKNIANLKKLLIVDINSFCFRKIKEIVTIFHNDEINDKEKSEIYSFYKKLTSEIKSKS